MVARVHPITMPKWGIEMQEGTITGWSAEPGQRVERGASLVDIETEKIVNSVESPVTGVLRRIIAQSGDTCAVGALIAVFADEDVPEAEIESFVAGFKPADASFEPEGPAPAQPAPETPAAPGPATTSGVSPIARRLAEKLGIDPAVIPGTGRNGRVSKEDVEAYAKSKGLMPGDAPPAAAANEPTRERMTSMRLTIARRLSESKQTIPHYRLAIDADASALLARRRQLGEAGTRVSVNDLLTRACALALVQHPRVNAQYVGDEVLCFPHADIAVAVSTDAGLVTPIVRLADTKSAEQISTEVSDLVARARAGRLTREEISGGTFTVSNLGMFGVDQFDAIINPPQVAILAAGAIRERVVARDGHMVVAPMISLQLSCDHRVVDGAAGGAFLDSLRNAIESAENL